MIAPRLLSDGRPGAGLQFIDFFCGAGGASEGLVETGMELVTAYNHWDRAIETHSANHDAEHVQADISNYDMRLLPRRIDLAWMSPECTFHSPAGGRKNPRQAELDLFEEYVPNAAGQRSRMTMWDVVRAAEARRFPVVIVENVVEVTGWELFHAWLGAMDNLGYHCQVVNVSAAHVWSPTNPAAPQWRDRLYFVFSHKGVPLPDVAPRPAAWCPECDELVQARQSWKRPDARFGKYGTQYVYVCPSDRHRPVAVEPFALPATAAIDWTDLGTRIADRHRPLADATMRRVRIGGAMFAGSSTVVAHTGHTWDAAKPTHPSYGNPHSYYRVLPADGAPLMARSSGPGDGLAVPPYMVSVNHGGADNRAFRPDQGPLPTRSTKLGDGLVMPAPFITELYGTSTARAIGNPLGAVTAGGNHQALTIPPGAFLSRQYGDGGHLAAHLNTGVDEPTHPITARGGGNHALVVPDGDPAGYYGHSGAMVVPTRKRPKVDLSPAELEALDVSDYRFRMLQWHEHAAAQRFPRGYRFTGNKSENTMMAGNAVASNVAHWLGERVAAALTGQEAQA